MKDMTVMAADIHSALRAWHITEGTAQNLLTDLLLVRKRQNQIAGESSPTKMRLATNQVLLDAIDVLAEQDEVSARLLRLRFPEDNTLLMVAHQLNISEYTVSRMQRKAIESLASILAAQEEGLRQKQKLAIEAQLPPASYSRLFGFHDVLVEMTDQLLVMGPPWVLAIVGIGGIGKTALTDALVRQIIGNFIFQNVIWLRVNPQTMSGRPNAPQVTYERLLSELARKLLVGESGSTEQQYQLIRNRLKAEPYLVVIDNIESDAETAYLLGRLNDLAQPGKFLLTSRPRLPAMTTVYQYSVNELSLDDSLALIRHHAGELGISAATSATEEQLQAVYELTGGNPLALKLTVSLLDLLPLTQVLDGLSRSRPGPIEDLYRYIYWQSWQTLSDNGRQLLQAMPLLGEAGGQADYLATISGLNEADLWLALHELRGRSLVEVQGTLEQKRYGLHRLTETFLRTEIINWPEDEQGLN